LPDDQKSIALKTAIVIAAAVSFFITAQIFFIWLPKIDVEPNTSAIISLIAAALVSCIVLTLFRIVKEFSSKSNREKPTALQNMERSLKEGRFFWILLGVTIVGLGLSIYWTLSNEYVPINKNTIFHDGRDLDVIVTAENYTNVPLQSFFNQKVGNVTVEVYYKILPIFLKGIKLSSNGSSILTTKNETFESVNKSKVPTNRTLSHRELNNTPPRSMPIPTSIATPAPTPAFKLINLQIKRATASLNLDGNRPEKTFDNKPNTRWAAPGDPQSISYTLDQKYNISGVGIMFFNDPPRQSYFEINGEHFNSSGKSTTFQNFTLKTPIMNTNALKIIGHGNSNNPWNAYNEVKIYAKNLSTIGPPKTNVTINQQTAGAARYSVSLNMGHPLRVGNYSDQYAINIFYRKIHDSGNILVDKIPFIWRIKTLDWSILSYFWILFAGVLLSRVFRFTDERGKFTGEKGNIKFTPLELIWVPFSAVITLLIFSSFMEQLFDKLTVNILMNLALAFAFGFGFDKVLEVWQKSPALKREDRPPSKEKNKKTSNS
jgi:hypothetical protein